MSDQVRIAELADQEVRRSGSPSPPTQGRNSPAPAKPAAAAPAVLTASSPPHALQGRIATRGP